MVQCSTRLCRWLRSRTGAPEIGISTDKFHARGPVWPEGLTSLKWIVLGEGQTRPDTFGAPRSSPATPEPAGRPIEPREIPGIGKAALRVAIHEHVGFRRSTLPRSANLVHVRAPRIDRTDPVLREHIVRLQALARSRAVGRPGRSR